MILFLEKTFSLQAVFQVHTLNVYFGLYRNFISDVCVTFSLSLTHTHTHTHTHNTHSLTHSLTLFFYLTHPLSLSLSLSLSIMCRKHHKTARHT